MTYEEYRGFGASMSRDNFEGLVLDGPMAGRRFSHGARFAQAMGDTKFKASMSPGEPPPPDLAAKVITMQHVEFIYGRGYWLVIEDGKVKEDAELRERALALLEVSFVP